MAAFRHVAAYAPPGAVGLGLGLTSAIFRSRPGLTTFEFDFCAARPGPLATDLGVPVLKAATGAAPHAWLLSQRLSLAEELLETTSLPVEQIAERVGYRSAAVFREQFAARRGLAPRDYRRTFSRDGSGGGGDGSYESVI